MFSCSGIVDWVYMEGLGGKEEKDRWKRGKGLKRRGEEVIVSRSRRERGKEEEG